MPGASLTESLLQAESEVGPQQLHDEIGFKENLQDRVNLLTQPMQQAALAIRQLVEERVRSFEGAKRADVRKETESHANDS